MSFSSTFHLQAGDELSRAVPVAVTYRLLLEIRLRFHNHAPQQRTRGLAFDQQAADEVGGNLLGGAGEEGLGERWGVLGGYGSGFGNQGILRHQAPPSD